MILLLLACVAPLPPTGACHPHPYYGDTDHDGLGGTTYTKSACSAEDGYVDNADDCDDTDATVTTGPDWYADADADGVGIGEPIQACTRPNGYAALNGDCDDTDFHAYPGASEFWYDGIDQDCDGNDADQDLDGSPRTDDTTGDCDDSDPDIHPGATEIPYNHVDEDCADGDLRDVDADGHDSDVVGGDDCDDADPSVSPSVDETCHDHIDQDCNGREDDGCSPTGDIDAEDADLIFWGATSGDGAGTSLAVADFDGDGQDDLAVGVPGLDGRNFGEGGVYVVGCCSKEGVLYDAAFSTIRADGGVGYQTGSTLAASPGGPADLLIGATGSIAAARIAGPLIGDYDVITRVTARYETVYTGGIQAGIASVGDIDGDGAPDVGLGYDEFAAVAPGNLTGEIDMTDWLVLGRFSLDVESVSAIGDVTADGYAEFAVSHLGRVWVMSGSATWPGAGDPSTRYLAAVTGSTADEFGASVTSGDIDDDGVIDLIVGSPGADDGGIDAGAVLVVPAPTAGVVAAADVTTASCVGTFAGEGLGRSVSIGDVDADGGLDVLTGGPASSTAVLFLSPLALATPAWATLTGTGSFGRAVSASGDLDLDGYADLVVGAPTAAPDGLVSGAAYVFFGRKP